MIDRAMIAALKAKIDMLFKDKKSIHINYGARRKNVKNALCSIKGVYDNFFCVESKINDYLESFTISYIQILTNEIKIIELTD